MPARTRVLILAIVFALGACSSLRPTPPLPTNGPILYNCADGAQLTVEFEADEARVAIIGGYAMVLPRTGTPEAPSYSNGRFSVSGGGREVTWRAANRAPVTCRGN